MPQDRYPLSELSIKGLHILQEKLELQQDIQLSTPAEENFYIQRVLEYIATESVANLDDILEELIETEQQGETEFTTEIARMAQIIHSIQQLELIESTLLSGKHWVLYQKPPWKETLTGLSILSFLGTVYLLIALEHNLNTPFQELSIGVIVVTAVYILSGIMKDYYYKIELKNVQDVTKATLRANDRRKTNKHKISTMPDEVQSQKDDELFALLDDTLTDSNQGQ